jgi:hypothetical protein
MEIIENFMATMQSDIPDTPRPSESETKKADTVFFDNLAFRPKP